LENRAALKASKIVNSLAIKGFGVGFPPSHTAFVGAEFFISFVWNMYERFAALWASIYFQ